MSSLLRDHEYPKGVRYAIITMWSLKTLVVLIILLIEVRTMYRVTRPKKKRRQSTTSNATSLQMTETHSQSKCTANTQQNADHEEPPEHQIISSPKRKLLLILPIITYALYALAGLFGVFLVNGVKECKIFSYAGPMFYAVGKCFMYFVYIYRIYIVYSDSVFEYSTKILTILFVFVIIYTIGQIIVFIFTGEHSEFDYPNGDRFCAAYISTANAIGVIIVDMFISVLCTYLFIRPLMLLARINVDNERTNALFETVSKFVILTSVSVLTTFFIFGAVVIVGITSLISIDVIINCVCLMFFNQCYDDLFKRVCCGSIRICHSLRNRKLSFANN